MLQLTVLFRLVSNSCIQRKDKHHTLCLLGTPPRSFDRFQAFVRAREAGLRATFDALDADGDGGLDAGELAAALEAVRVRCPDTRRVSHCRKKVG